MTRAFRWVLRLFLAGVVLSALAATLAYYLATRSLPDYSESFELPGLSAPMRIVRDTANVPHVFGATETDSFFGLGFVHAQDRLWQMTMMRRTAQGRLSEIFGPRTLKIDETLRRLDIYRLAVQSQAIQDDATLAALDAYAAGVNAWIDQVNTGARGRGAPEFFLFPPEIAPWQPSDSLAIAKLMALKLTAHLQDEVLRARTALTVSPERLRDILPDDPTGGLAVLAALGPAPTAADTQLAGNPLLTDPLSPFSPPALAGASNVWAAMPDRSTTGSTLLANDPHLGLTAPSIWYLARIEIAGGGVIGGTIPGMPLILVGRNEDLAWGLTSAYADDQDLYVERLDPTNPNAYETPTGAMAPFRTEGALVRVKGAEPVTLTLRWTDRGPVLPGDLFDLNTIVPAGHVASLAWTALTPDDRTMTAGMHLMQQRAVAPAIEAMAEYVAPAQNLVLADRETVAMVMIGALPRRSAQHDSLGRLPAPGWRAENHWQGRLPFDTNPRFTDPDGGLLGNTNNKPLERAFPLHVSYAWGDSQRVHRWERLMRNREVHSRDSFMEAQLDTISPAARSLLPLIGADLWFTGEAAPDGSPARARREALDLLANWNGDMNEHMPEPLIYAAWVQALQQRLIVDELGRDLAAAFSHPDPIFLERVFRDVDGASAWCDVSRSSGIETCRDMAERALDDALLWISETYRGGLEGLQWGSAHQATHDHEVLGGIPGLGWLVNIRQPTSGGDHTLNRGRTAGLGAQPFLNVHAAGYRGVYDMADPDSSVFVIATGQSGHPFSRFYDNLGERWRRGEYIPMSLDPALAEAAATGVTTLRPAP
ncbi:MULTISPECIES: penicillin acylase family protein [unclassified Meridianimarinicoccus]|uniref:penicillin acylase family protein n=1 Tax=unclassified Meridianimarinicoccus TaxID=2923344 RepID=UPI001865BD6B|nr:penicillin acylase family protein [Fluviibacterium sp. MJW13]